MINICICDDDEKYCSSIEEYIINFSRQLMVDCDIDIYTSGEALLKARNENDIKYQLCFLDIEMNKINGIETASYIRKKDREMLIVYISSYDRYTLESFAVSPFRYILKPVNKEEIENILSLAYNEIMINNQYLFFKYQNIHYQVKYENIVSIESEGGRMINVNTNDEVKLYKFYGKMKELENKLNPMIFIRVSSGVFVNFNYIYIISGYKIQMVNGSIYMISRTKNKNVKDAYNEYLKRKIGI